MTTWTDWRGNEYTEGDTVLYARLSGRSCEMAEGVVVELWEVYYCPDTYKWKRMDPRIGPPFKKEYAYFDQGNCMHDRNEVTGSEARVNGWEWREYVSNERAGTERRAKIMPGRTSRFNSYADRGKKWTWDAEAETGEYVTIPEEDLKPVTLKVTESITVPR